MVTLVLAVAPDGIIGNKGRLPWHLPEELDHFRKSITGTTLISGRVTFLGLPKSLRESEKHLVVSSKLSSTPSVNVFITSSELAEYLSNYSDADYSLIGGAQLAKALLDLDLVDRAVISHIHHHYEGDIIVDLSRLASWSRSNSLSTPDFTVATYTRPRS